MESRIPEPLYPILRELDNLERYSELPSRPEDLATGEKMLKRLFRGELTGAEGAMRGLKVNVIPPVGRPGPCREVLLVTIGTRDSVGRRILEAIEHVGVRCRGVTKYVIFYAAKWDQSEWLRYLWSFSGASVVLKNAPYYTSFTIVVNSL